jgi:hypothetical protein
LRTCQGGSRWPWRIGGNPASTSLLRCENRLCDPPQGRTSTLLPDLSLARLELGPTAATGSLPFILVTEDPAETQLPGRWTPDQGFQFLPPPGDAAAQALAEQCVKTPDGRGFTLEGWTRTAGAGLAAAAGAGDPAGTLQDYWAGFDPFADGFDPFPDGFDPSPGAGEPASPPRSPGAGAGVPMDPDRFFR